MSSSDPSFVDDSSSDVEFDLNEEEDIAMLVVMHKGKKPKHGGYVYGAKLCCMCAAFDLVDLMNYVII